MISSMEWKVTSGNHYPRQSGLSVYSEHAFLTLGCQETITCTSLSPCTSCTVRSLHSNTFTGAQCCCILDAYIPGYRYILYSEGSYVTVYSLQNMHLFPLIEITLTMNLQDGWTALMLAAQNGHSNVVETLLQHGASVDMKITVSAWLTEPSFISITSMWYITSTDWYNYVECV